MKTLFARLKEPSTWAGLAALAAMFGARPEATDAVLGVVTAVAGAAGGTNHVVIGQIIGAVCGAAAVFLPERKAAL